MGNVERGSQVPMSHPCHNSACTKEEKLQAERKKLEEHHPLSIRHRKCLKLVDFAQEKHLATAHKAEVLHKALDKDED